MTHAALILAGGTATRMGGPGGGIDKPLLTLATRPLLAHILATLAADTAQIALSANGNPARFAAFALPVLPDQEFPHTGPLAGLLAGLEWAATQGAETLLTIPGDTPFIPPRLAASLKPAPAIATSAGRAHPLVALWPITARTPLRAFLTQPGPHRAHAFAALLNARQVDFPAVPCDPFLNINTPADLAHASRLMEQNP